MADDTVQTGTDTIATDHVTTLNGGAVTQTAASPKVQRVKVGYGDDGTARDVSATFPLPVTLPASTTPAVTGVAASAASVTVLTSNPARELATVQNHSTSATLYLRLGAVAASIASGGYTVALVAGAYYEVPGGYTGEITGIWAAASGFCNVTELT